MITTILKIFGAAFFILGVLLVILGGLAAIQGRPAIVALPWGLVLMLIGGPAYALARIVQLLERIAENTRQPYLSRPAGPPDDVPRVEREEPAR